MAVKEQQRRRRMQRQPVRRISAMLSHVRPAAADVETGHQSGEVVREPDDSLYDAHVAEVAVQDQLPVVVLDMLLPRQRVKLTVNDASHTRMVCSCLDDAAARGTAPCFGVVGIDPLSGQPLSFGVECEVMNSNHATGAMQIELLGRRCFTVRDTSQQSEGYAVAEVSWAFAEPAEPGADIGKAMTQLYTLTEQWLELVVATGAEQYPGHIGAQLTTQLAV